MTLYVGKDEYGKLVFRRTLRVRDSLLCCIRTRVHMELRRDRKRTLKVLKQKSIWLVNITCRSGSRRQQRGRCREPEKVCEV